MKKKQKSRELEKQSVGDRAETEIELYYRLFNTVAEYFFNNYRSDVEEAFDCDWGRVFQGNLIDSQEHPLADTFFDWLIHSDSVFEPGFNSIELFLEEKKKLTDVERAMLRKMNESVISLFDITISETKDSALYQDMLLGGEYTRNGLEISSERTKGLLAGRRMVLDGELMMGFGYYPFDPELKDDILVEIREGFEEFRETESNATMEQYLKNVDPLPALWLEGFQDEEEEGLDDLPEEMKSAIFTIIGSHKKVLEKLRTISSLQEAEESEPIFIWMKDGESEEPKQCGLVTVSGGMLILGAFTPELREAGKIMLLSACTGLIRHLRDLDFNTEELFNSPGDEE